MGKHLLVLAAAILTSWALLCVASSATPSLSERVTREKLDKTWAQRITGLLKLCALKDFTLACQAKSMSCTLEAPSGEHADLKVVDREGALYFSRISGIPPE